MAEPSIASLLSMMTQLIQKAEQREDKVPKREKNRMAEKLVKKTSSLKRRARFRTIHLGFRR